MKKELRSDFEVIVTEVDGENTRSLNAHKAVGFEVLKEYRADNKDWVIVRLHCN